MPYKTDTRSLFEQLPPGVRQGEVTNGSTVENKPFSYPTNIARVSNFTGLGQGSLSDANNQSVTLTRGFMRNLMTDLGENQPKFPDVRCFFQFNPQDIEHIIEARKDMYLPILQDPNQLRQPMAGNAMFNFELVFDRTMEVNSAAYRTVSQGGEPIPDTKSPGTVGVFHDLRVLYSIIGQGLSEELLAAQQAKLKNDVRQFAIKNYNSLNLQYNSETSEFKANQTLLDPSEDTYGDDPNAAATANFLNSIVSNPESSSINTFMADFNIGNSAFLIPQPCRVVFSPVFMVDGFVMGTKVLFTKFSTKMIPTQCKVYISMQATYLGFARAKTFITEQLDETARQNTENERAAVTELGSVGYELSSAITNITVGFSSDPRVITKPSDSTSGLNSTQTYDSILNDISTTVGYAYQPLWLYATKGFWYTRPSIPNYAGAPAGTGAKANVDGGGEYDPLYMLQSPSTDRTPHFQPQLSVRICPSEESKKKIKEDVFEKLQSSNPKLTFEVVAHMFGPFATQSAAQTFTDTKIGKTPFSSLSSDIKSSGLYVGKYSVRKEIATADKWDDYAKDPQNWTMDMKTTNDDSNSLNTAPDPITPSTTNAQNKSVVDEADARIAAAYASALNDYPSQTFNINSAIKDTKDLYYDGITSMVEKINPRWDGPDINFRGAIGMPQEVYQITVENGGDRLDSLLQLVDNVHGLSSKYFSIVVDAVIVYEIETAAGVYKKASPGGIRTTAIKSGSDFGFTTSLNLGWGGLAVLPF